MTTDAERIAQSVLSRWASGDSKGDWDIFYEEMYGEDWDLHYSEEDDNVVRPKVEAFRQQYDEVINQLESDLFSLVVKEAERRIQK